MVWILSFLLPLSLIVPISVEITVWVYHENTVMYLNTSRCGLRLRLFIAEYFETSDNFEIYRTRLAFLTPKDPTYHPAKNCESSARGGGP